MFFVLLLACHAPAELSPIQLFEGQVGPDLDRSIEARVDEILPQLSLEEKAAMMSGGSLLPPEDGWPTEGVPRLGIPGFRMTDGPRGVGLAERATVFPVGVARAAAWDVGLEEEIGRAMGAEARFAGKNVLLAPTLNLVRHPRWGRAQESYGEEPLLLGSLARAFVQGAEEHVFATPKHFAANSIEATRYEVDVQMDERTLREVYLPHFHMAILEGGAGMVMASYNRLNGPHATENRHLLTDILKEEWGFNGVVMSDWIWGMTDGALALNAGLDLEMPTLDQMRGIADRVAAGEVPLTRLDDAVRRQLRMTLLDERRSTPEVDFAAHQALARRAAAEGMVLLKNEAALPLSAGARVAVVGALADVVNTGDRGSSNVRAGSVVTPLDGLAERFDVLPVPTDAPDPAQLADIRAAEAAVVVVGLTWEDEGEGITESNPADRDHLDLSAAELQLIDQVSAVQPRTVVIIEGSGPVIVEPFIDDVAGLVMAWYPGQEGGNALADLLVGERDFNGRLPMGWPRAEAQLQPFDGASLEVEYGMLHGWRWMERYGEQPRFPFGYGLSYSGVELVDARLSGEAWPQDSLAVEGRLTGQGAQTVMVFASPDAPQVERPDRVLVGFARVEVDGEATFSIPIPAMRLATWQDGWWLEQGDWTIEVGKDAGASAFVLGTRVEDVD